MAFRRQEVRPFTDSQIALLKTFADQAVIAIENVRLFKELQARNAELTESLEQQTVTSDILRIISSSPTDTQPVFDAIVKSGVRLFGGLEMALRLVKGDQSEIVATTESLLAGDRIPTPLDDDRRPSARAIRHRQVVQIPDISAEEVSEVTRARAERRGNRALLHAPLLREGKAIGVISVYRAAPGLFTEKEIALLKTFADQAVIAIENVRLFKELEARNRDLSRALDQQTATSEILRVIASSPTDLQPVFDAVLERALTLCEAAHGSLYRFDGQALRHVASVGTVGGRAIVPMGSTVPMESGPGRAILEQRTLHFEDTLLELSWQAPEVVEAIQRYGIRSALAVPLLREGTAIGALLIRRLEVRPFSDAQIRLVETFADQAVIAIENVRLFKALQARNAEVTETLEQQTATAEILRVISSSPTEVEPVFDAIVQSGVHLFGGLDVTLRLVKDEQLAVVASTLPGDGWVAIPMRDDRFVATRSVHVREVVQAADVLDEDWVSEDMKRLAESRGFRAAMAAPLLREGNAIGVIAVTRVNPGLFTDKQVALLKTFADQAVIAIENVRLFKELQAKNANLTEALEQQTATSEILRVISSSPTDLQPVFQTILAKASSLCDASLAALFRYDGDVLTLAAHQNASPATVEHFAKARVRPGRETTVRLAALEKKVVHVTDVLQDPRFISGNLPLVKLEGARTILAVPMLRENALVGVISIWRREPRPFSDNHIELVKTFADQAVIAIENVRLFKELQAKNADLTEALEQQTATADVLKVISRSPTDLKPVFDAILENATRLCDAHMADLALIDGDTRIPVAQRGGSAEFANWVMSTKPLRIVAGTELARMVAESRPIHVADVRDSSAYRDGIPGAVARVELGGARTSILVPLLKESRVVGCITIYRPEVRPFTQKQIDLVSTFANQAVIAIENVRLFNETKEALEQQTVISEILRVISSSPTDTQPVFDAIVKSGVRLFGGMTMSLRLIRGDHTVTVASTTPVREDTGGEFPVPLSDMGALSSRAIARREVVQLADLLNAEDWVSPLAKKRAELRGYRANMCAPMLREGKAIGTVNVNRATPGPFTDKQVALIRTFADQAVIAIENVRLFKELQAKNADLTEALEQQTATSEILRVISSSPTDLQPVFDAILEKATRLCDAHLGMLGLYDGKNYQTVAQRSSNPEFAKWVIERGPYEPSLSHGAIGRMVVEREPVHIPDYRETPGYRNRLSRTVALVELGGVRTNLSVPMLKEGRLIGGITIYRPEVRPFTQKQIDLLSTFASQAVIAIENVRLFKELQSRNAEITEALEQQTATADILRVISSSPIDVQPVFDAIAENAARLCAASDVVIRRVDGEVLRLVTHKGPIPVVADTLALTRGTIPGCAVIERRTIHIHDTQEAHARGEYPEGTPLQRGAGDRTFLAVPLVRDNVALA
jgi:GAF domain-containing protein